MINDGVLEGRADRILLIGVARSGTSWLSRAMAATPGTVHYYEPDNVDADPTGQRPVGKSGFGPYPIIEPGQDGGQFRALWDAAFAGRLPKVQGINEGYKLKAMRLVLKMPSAIREPLISAGAKVLTAMPGGPERTAIKSIYSAFYLEWLVQRYDPRTVVIQRHPLNVVSSWRGAADPGVRPDEPACPTRALSRPLRRPASEHRFQRARPGRVAGGPPHDRDR